MGNAQARQLEQRNMAQRRGSMSWNFRYPIVRRREHATVMVYNPKLSIAEWLDLLDLQQYENNFHLYNRIEDIVDFTEKDLKQLGIRNAVQRTKMLTSLLGVQAKRRQSMNLEVTSATRATAHRRKNSCPPVCLTPIDDICDDPMLATLADKQNSVERNNSMIVTKSGKALKRLTFDESTMLYETLKPQTSKTNSPLSKIPEHQQNNSNIEDDMEAPSTPNGVQTHTAAAAAAAATTNTNTTTPPCLTLNSNEQQEAIALKKALEWELSLDSRELRSHAWYHGPLSRQRAEEIVQRDGDFLVRDCTSQPDNYVLSCRTKTAVLHFVINKILLQPETVYERVQYQFEEDAFDAVPDLITFYVGSGKSVSIASGARIQYPCNRTYPLSFYGHKIVGNQLHSQMLAGIRSISPLNSPLGSNPNSVSFRFGSCASNLGQPQLQSPQQQQQQQQQTQPQLMSPEQQQQQQQQQQLLVPTIQSPMSSPPHVRRDMAPPAPRLPSKKQRSQSLTPAQAMVVSNIKNGTVLENGDGFYSESVAVASSNGFRETRRFSNFEKSSCQSLNIATTAVGDNQKQLEQQLAQLKVHGNGFQTIARCTTSSDTLMDHVKFTTHSLPRPTSAAHALRSQAAARISSLARNFSMDVTSLEGKQIPELPEKPPSPPPKPGRQVQILPRKEFIKEQPALPVGGMEQQYALQRANQAVLAYQASGSDSGNGSGDSVQSSAPGDGMIDMTMQRGVVIKNPRFMSSSASNSTLKSFTEFDAMAAEEQLFTLEIPELKWCSKFDFENFGTLLLPSVENKPLDGDALNTFKMMLLETGPKLIAEHITRIDIGLIIDEEIPPGDKDKNEHEEHQPIENEEEVNFLNLSGLELLILPHGKVFRDDLIERTQCIKLMVAVTILTCQTDLDRAELLSKWIQIAVETKTALGNLFGFCAIMLGLCMQQIQKLDQAWHILRQKYTDSAFTFEAKLRPTLISMNEASNPQAPNTTVPHVLLYSLLMDRPIMDIINAANIADRPALYGTCIAPWETKADDFGMSINFQHLDSARSFLKNLNLYRKNAKTILEDASSRLDELLSDAFKTEFHVKFLWGSTGALAKPEDRHSKLEKVLTLMADKFCSANNQIAA